MHPRQSLPTGLAALAERQAGVLTTRQLIDGGLTRAVIRRMAAGWVQACEGIHLTGRVSWEAAAWAGLLRGGHTAVLTEDAAAFLHGVLRDQPTTIAVAAAGKRSGFSVGPWSIAFRRGTHRPMGSPPRVGVELALVGLACRATEDAAVAAVARALAQGRTTSERILAQLRARRRSRHSSVLTELCGEAASGIESALERRFAHSCRGTAFHGGIARW